MKRLFFIARFSAHVDSLLKSGDWRAPPPAPTPGSAGGGGRRGAARPGAASGDSAKKRTLKRKRSTPASASAGGGDAHADGARLDRRKVVKRRKRPLPSVRFLNFTFENSLERFLGSPLKIPLRCPQGVVAFKFSLALFLNFTLEKTLEMP